MSGVRAELVAAGRAASSSQRQVVRLAAALDRDGEWALDGARTCAHWIAEALDVEVSTAREWVRIGHALEQFAIIDAAFADHRLSYSKVRALTRVATIEREAELCELAYRTPAGHLSRALAAWLSSTETPEETERRQHEARSFSYRVEPDGMVVGTFRLPPVEGAVITNSVDMWTLRHGQRSVSAAQRDAGASADASTPPCVNWPSTAQQRADGLVALVQGGGSRIVTEIVMHVRADGCSLDDGTPIAGSVVERIAPDAFLRVLVHDAASRPINASSRQRHPTTRQQRVVRERDRVCIDCGGTEFLEYDHEPAFAHSRRTVVDELGLRCRECHRQRHEEEEEAA